MASIEHKKDPSKVVPEDIDAELPYERKETINLLPSVNQTETLTKFFASTVDYLFQPKKIRKFNGYVGQKPSYWEQNSEFYLAEPTKSRETYQLEPVMVSKDIDNNITHTLFYEDIVNHIRFQGGITNSHSRMFDQEYYSWCPPIDLDKLTSFNHYFWLINGPDVIEITEPTDIDNDIRDQLQYTFPVSSLKLTSGLRIKITDDVNTSYNDVSFAVEAVGRGIILIDNSEQFAESCPWDFCPWDEDPWEVAVGAANSGVSENPDYMLMERGAKDVNPWSTTNRWYHKDVIELSGTALITDISNLQAKRPIIEFERDIELFGYGDGIEEMIDVIYLESDDIYLDLDGTFVWDTSIALNDPLNILGHLYGQHGIAGEIVSGVPQMITMDGVSIRDGLRFLVTNDLNPGVNHKIYEIQGIKQTGKIVIVPVVSTLPNTGDQYRVRFGSTYEDSYIVFDGVGWSKAQEKLGINQPPVFQLYDVDTVKLNDPGVYPENDFAGSKIFSYQENTLATQPIDDELGIRVSYNIHGDIIYDNNMHKQRYVYDKHKLPIEGYYLYRLKGDTEINDVYSNSWHQIEEFTKQYVVYEFITKESQTEFELAFEPDPFISGELAPVIVEKAGERMFNGVNYTISGNIVTIPGAQKDDFYIIKAFARNYVPVDTDETIYEIPVNLQGNPDNLEVEEVTSSDFFIHFRDILENQENFEGIAYSKNNWRDTAQKRTFGRTILQHRASLLKLMLLSSTEDLDFMLAVRYVEHEYNRFKNKYIQYTNELINNTSFYTKTATGWFTAAVTYINVGKNSTFPFYNSEVAGEHTYIPPTASFLGVSKAYKPEFYIDDKFYEPTWVIRGHDNSQFVMYGTHDGINFTDQRDAAVFEFENKIYDTIPNSYKDGSLIDYLQPEFLVGELFPGKFRKKDYSREEVTQIFRPMFERWAASKGVDYRTNTTYEQGDKFTWNYSSSKDKDGKSIPGNWRAIYNWYYDTDRPNTHPWEMLGFTVKPIWWEGRYGPAPYTGGNALLWDDLEQGNIADGPRKGIAKNYTRPGLSSVIPVDSTGVLLDPFTTGIVTQPIIQPLASARWEFGDQGVIENVWRKSEFFGFAIAQAIYLMKPARLIELGWDPDKWEYIFPGTSSFQWTNSRTRNRPHNSQLSVHGEKLDDGTTYIGSGIDQWISDWVVSRGQNITEKFGNPLRGVGTMLGYKIGAFMDSRNLQVQADNFGLIPQEDIIVQSYLSPSVAEHHYSGVIIEWTGKGFSITGYDVLNPVFKTIPHNDSGKTINISVGEIEPTITSHWNTKTVYQNSDRLVYQGIVYSANINHTSTENFERDKWDYIGAQKSDEGIAVTEYVNPNVEGEIHTISYGTVFATQQDVYNFLMDYQRWLEFEGWLFDEYDYDNNEVINWRKSGKEFLAWSVEQRDANDFIAISPAGLQVKFKAEHGAIQSVEQIINGVYSLLDKTARRIHPRDTSVARNIDTMTIIPDNKNQGIYSARLFLRELEHVMLINNKTIFNDLIYDPLFNIRQLRVKITGVKTRNWTGRLDAPGFIIQDNDIYSNFDKTAEDFEYFYGIEESVDSPELRDHARHLIGYQTRDYLNNLLPDPDVQFQFYQGMIQQKGTKESMNKLLRVQDVTGEQTLNIFEEWAFRIGRFGALNLKQSIEFQLDRREVRNNPQLIQFGTNGPENIGRDLEFDDVIHILEDDERWLRKPADQTNIWPKRDHFGDKKLDYWDAGYVKLNEVNFTTWDKGTLLNVYTEAGVAGTPLEVGNNIWVYDTGLGEFDVYKVTDTGVTICNIKESDADGTTQVEFSSPTDLSDTEFLIITSDTESKPNFEGINTIASTLVIEDSAFVVETTVPGEIININGTPVTLTGTTIDDAVSDITSANITDIVVDNYNDKLRFVSPNEIILNTGLVIETGTADPIVSIAETIVINGNTVTIPGTAGVTGTTVDPKFESGGTIKINDTSVTLTGSLGAEVVGTLDEPTYETNKNISINGTVIDLISGTAEITGNIHTPINYTTATANAILSAPPLPLGSIEAIIIDNDGLNYSSPPTVIITDGITANGTGAIAEAVILNGAVTKINVIQAGTGYTTPVVTLSAPIEIPIKKIVINNKEIIVNSNNSIGTLINAINARTSEHLVIASYVDPAEQTRIKLTANVSIHLVADEYNSLGIFGLDEGVYNAIANIDDIVNDINSANVSDIVATNYAGLLKLTSSNAITIINSSNPVLTDLGLEAGYFKTKGNLADAISQITTEISDVTASNDGNKLKLESATTTITTKNADDVFGIPDRLYGESTPEEIETVICPLIDALPDITCNYIDGVVQITSPNTFILAEGNSDALATLGFVPGTYESALIDLSLVSGTYTDTSGVRLFIQTETGFDWSSDLTNSPKVLKLVSTRFATLDTRDAAIEIWEEGDMTYVDDARTASDLADGVEKYWATFSFDGAWQLVRKEEKRMASRNLINGVIYDKRKNVITQWVDVYDPRKGIISQKAEAELHYKLEYDPAVYTNGEEDLHNIIPSKAWGPQEEGRLWWDVSTAKYFDYELGDDEYRTQMWGKLVPGATVNVYEWSRSTVPPLEYVDIIGEPIKEGRSASDKYTGEAKDADVDITAWTERSEYNEKSGNFQTYYYYWVKNRETVPTNPERKIASAFVSRLIENPTKEGIIWFAPISEKSIITANIFPFLVDEDTVLQLNWNNDNTEINIHQQWEIMREGDKNSTVDDIFWNKMKDSIVATDAIGNDVPDPALSEVEIYGIEYRPRQTMFSKLDIARKIFIDYINKTLAAEAVVINRINWDKQMFLADPIPAPPEYIFHVATIAERDQLVLDSLLNTGDRVLVDPYDDMSYRWSVWTFTNTLEAAWTIEPRDPGVDDRLFYEYYKMEDYWEYVDWYVDGYSSSNILADTFSTQLAKDIAIIAGQTFKDKDLIKINDGGNGLWVVEEFNATVNEWTIIGYENGTIQISSNFYEFIESTNLSGITFPYPTAEYRILFDALRKDIFTDLEQNLTFFTMINYIHSEQTIVDWVFKTSYLYLSGMEEEIKQTNILKTDHTDNLITYIEETKPYHCKIRDFVQRKSIPIDIASVHVTDFDNPIYYDVDLDEYRMLDPIADANILKENMPWADWWDDYQANYEHVRKIKTKIVWDRVKCWTDLPKQGPNTDCMTVATKVGLGLSSIQEYTLFTITNSVAAISNIIITIEKNSQTIYVGDNVTSIFNLPRNVIQGESLTVYKDGNLIYKNGKFLTETVTNKFAFDALGSSIIFTFPPAAGEEIVLMLSDNYVDRIGTITDAVIRILDESANEILGATILPVATGDVSTTIIPINTSIGYDTNIILEINANAAIHGVFHIEIEYDLNVDLSKFDISTLDAADRIALFYSPVGNSPQKQLIPLDTACRVVGYTLYNEIDDPTSSTVDGDWEGTPWETKPWEMETLVIEPGSDFNAKFYRQKYIVKPLSGCDFRGTTVEGKDPNGFNNDGSWDSTPFDTKAWDGEFLSEANPRIDLILKGGPDDFKVNAFQGYGVGTFDTAPFDTFPWEESAFNEYKLPYIPLDPSVIQVAVDGIEMIYGVDFTVPAPPGNIINFALGILPEFGANIQIVDGDTFIEPPTGPSDIIVEGNKFAQPHWAEDHPEELVKTKITSSVSISVYYPGETGSPIIVADRYISDGVKTEYDLVLTPQSNEGLFVYVDGKFLTYGIDFTIDWSNRLLKFVIGTTSTVPPAGEEIKISMFGPGGHKITEQQIIGGGQLTPYSIQVPNIQQNVFILVDGEYTTDFIVAGSLITFTPGFEPSVGTSVMIISLEPQLYERQIHKEPTTDVYVLTSEPASATQIMVIVDGLAEPFTYNPTTFEVTITSGVPTEKLVITVFADNEASIVETEKHLATVSGQEIFTISNVSQRTRPDHTPIFVYRNGIRLATEVTKYITARESQRIYILDEIINDPLNNMRLWTQWGDYPEYEYGIGFVVPTTYRGHMFSKDYTIDENLAELGLTISDLNPGDYFVVFGSAGGEVEPSPILGEYDIKAYSVAERDTYLSEPDGYKVLLEQDPDYDNKWTITEKNTGNWDLIREQAYAPGDGVASRFNNDWNVTYEGIPADTKFTSLSGIVWSGEWWSRVITTPEVTVASDGTGGFDENPFDNEHGWDNFGSTINIAVDYNSRVQTELHMHEYLTSGEKFIVYTINNLGEFDIENDQLTVYDVQPDDEIDITTLSFDDTYHIHTQVFDQTIDGRYKLSQMPYSDDYIWVHVNGKRKMYMRDYRISQGYEGWDMAPWDVFGASDDYNVSEEDIENGNFDPQNPGNADPSVEWSINAYRSEEHQGWDTSEPFGIIQLQPFGADQPIDKRDVALESNPKIFSTGAWDFSPWDTSNWEEGKLSPLHELMQLLIPSPPNVSEIWDNTTDRDQIIVTTIAGPPSAPHFAYRMFQDNFGEWGIERISDEYKTFLRDEYKENDIVINVNTNPHIPEQFIPLDIFIDPNPNKPGTIWIEGQRLDYYHVDRFIDANTGRTWYQLSNLLVESKGTTSRHYLLEDEETISNNRVKNYPISTTVITTGEVHNVTTIYPYAQPDERVGNEAIQTKALTETFVGDGYTSEYGLTITPSYQTITSVYYKNGTEEIPVINQGDNIIYTVTNDKVIFKNSVPVGKEFIINQSLPSSFNLSEVSPSTVEFLRSSPGNYENK